MVLGEHQIVIFCHLFDGLPDHDSDKNKNQGPEKSIVRDAVGGKKPADRNFKTAKENCNRDNRSAVQEPGDDNNQVVKLRVYYADMEYIVDNNFEKYAYENKNNQDLEFQAIRNLVYGIGQITAIQCIHSSYNPTMYVIQRSYIRLGGFEYKSPPIVTGPGLTGARGGTAYPLQILLLTRGILG